MLVNVDSLETKNKVKNEVKNNMVPVGNIHCIGKFDLDYDIVYYDNDEKILTFIRIDKQVRVKKQLAKLCKETPAKQDVMSLLMQHGYDLALTYQCDNFVLYGIKNIYGGRRKYEEDRQKIREFAIENTMKELIEEGVIKDENEFNKLGLDLD